MDIMNIKYGNNILKEQIKLERQLVSLKREQESLQPKCDHVMLYFGSEIENRPYDIPGKECLFCRATEVEEGYPTINAFGYGRREDVFFSAKRQREISLAILQDHWIEWIEQDPTLTKEDLVEKLREEIKRDEEENKKAVMRKRKYMGYMK